jgi:dihydroorotase-like cyclic amidohydrolase
MPLRTVITGGQMVTDDGDIRADVVIDDHEIVAKLATAEGVDADHTIDATDLLIMPGAIDIRIPSPWIHDTAQADTALATSHAAAAGGVTSFGADPGTPEETGAPNGLVADVALWHLVTGSEELTAVQASRLIQTGIVGFSAVFRPNGSRDQAVSTRELYDLMKVLGSFGVPLAVQPLHPSLDPRDPLSERLAIATILLFAEETGAWVHFDGVTTSSAMRQIVDARARGARVTVSVPALHLALTAGNETRHIRATPPFRDQGEVDELWSFVLDETVDCISSTRVRRASAKDAAIVDSQIVLSLFWDEAVNRRQMSHAQAVRMLSSNAAQILGIHPRKGTLRIGGDADIVLFDPAGTWTARDRDMLDGSHWSPIDGREMTGFVVRTMRRGKTVYDAERHDELMIAPGSGTLLTRTTIQR